MREWTDEQGKWREYDGITILVEPSEKWLEENQQPEPQEPPSDFDLLKEENLQIMLAQAETFEMIQRLDIEKSLAIAELAELVLGGGE